VFCFGIWPPSEIVWDLLSEFVSCNCHPKESVWKLLSEIVSCNWHPSEIVLGTAKCILACNWHPIGVSPCFLSLSLSLVGIWNLNFFLVEAWILNLPLVGILNLKFSSLESF
jgi:hypothetical protein